MQIFDIKTPNETFQAKTVLIATGSRRRKLDVPGAKEFENKGLTYCATCDGPLYGGMDTVVIGGGNAGFEAAAQLLAYCKSVTLLIRGGEFKADPGTIEAVLANPKMTAIKYAIPKKISGNKFVESITYEDVNTHTEKTLNVNGIFVEIGSLPNTGMVKGLVEIDNFDKVVVNAKNQRTSEEGIWAAGDCTDGLFHQNNIAAGDAVKAIEDIYSFVSKLK
jgi:alkyl hydroperoxide reductase subunit F